MLIMGFFSSCTNMAAGGLSSILASSYLAEDADIDNAELIYTEWETDLQMQINRAESDFPGYDEYRYSVDDIGHNPYELMAFLTATHQNFTYSQVSALLREMFEEQYSLSFTPEVEIRTRIVTGSSSVYDPDTGDYLGEESYEYEEEYEWHILNINLSARSFTNVAASRMDSDQREIHDLLMRSRGNRQYLSNVFDFNWLPYVSSYYGWRVHPISGEKNYHMGIDIAVPQGTPILAGHDGVITDVGYDAGGYGNYVVITGDDGLVSKYAHCDSVSVSIGQEVTAGDAIATVGSTGNSTGSHLHLEVIKNGQYLNPIFFALTGDDGFSSLPPGSPGGPVIPDYPGEPMGDGSFAALMEEAQKHLGKPYVFGANGPDSFDCSSFVSWVLDRSGVNPMSRTTAQGLYNICTPVSMANAMPGDLIFFHSTYSSPNPVSHVGIYIGNGQMIHAGNPIQYTSIETSYWQNHFYAIGRVGN
jgi:Membrane proteins related to metalloendopeptidases